MTPFDPGTVRAQWLQVCIAHAPTAPGWLVVGVAAFLADDRADTEALLILSSALTEAATEAAFHSQAMARGLEALAKLPKVLIAHRASQGKPS